MIATVTRLGPFIDHLLYQQQLQNAVAYSTTHVFILEKVPGGPNPSPSCPSTFPPVPFKKYS